MRTAILAFVTMERAALLASQNRARKANVRIIMCVILKPKFVTVTFQKRPSNREMGHVYSSGIVLLTNTVLGESVYFEINLDQNASSIAVLTGTSVVMACAA